MASPRPSRPGAQEWVPAAAPVPDLAEAARHFRYQQKGRRRIHRTPDLAHLIACRPWLEAELDAVGPQVVVALGALATRSLLGPDVRVTRDRGRVFGPGAAGRPGRGTHLVVPTVHPSSVLRGPPEARGEAFAGLVRDLGVARDALGSPPEGTSPEGSSPEGTSPGGS
ncbi:MAG TPA: uracil-DNA glycosylase family protein [Kineosporiaceae bacterium]|nr:uracil-DNA glycosylase family protein [Kineosporiaceae bacterium]